MTMPWSDAAFRQLNIIRVKGMEEMFATAGVLAYNTLAGRPGRSPAGRGHGLGRRL